MNPETPNPSPAAPDDVAMDVARKLANTRRIIGSATDADLEHCRVGYSAIDNDAARLIVRICDAEIAWRASSYDVGIVR